MKHSNNTTVSTAISAKTICLSACLFFLLCASPSFTTASPSPWFRWPKWATKTSSTTTTSPSPTPTAPATPKSGSSFTQQLPSFTGFWPINDTATNSPPAVFTRSNAFYINGSPTLLIGSSFQWFRMAPELWEDRLLRMKGMGMNAIDMYVSWRAHEPREGVFDFETYNIRAFLDLCQKLNLYVYFRPGPYITNELDGGGVPSWVFAKSTKSVISDEADGLINLRTQDKDYLEATRKYFSQLNRVIKPYLATRGGPIVLYAIENEYTWFEGAFETDKFADYPYAGTPERPRNQTLDVAFVMKSLRDFVLNDGVDVPITTCPGDGKISATGDIPGVVPMPNVYVGFELEEYKYYSVLKDMHDPTKHNGVYVDFPTGISETSIHTMHLRKSLMSGADTTFLFNAIGFQQENYQNCILANGQALDPTFENFVKLVKRLLDFSDINYVRRLFFSPEIGYFPNNYDYFSAVSPSGLHREKYFNIRRVNLFMQTYNNILANVGTPRRSSMKRLSSEEMELNDIDNSIRVTDPRAASKDPKYGSLYYWLPLGEETALVGFVNDGLKEVIALPPESVQTKKFKFPMFTRLAVPLEQHSDERDRAFHRVYMMMLPVQWPLPGGYRLAYSTSEILTVRKVGKENWLILTGGRGLQSEMMVCTENLSRGADVSQLNVVWKDHTVAEYANFPQSPFPSEDDFNGTASANAGPTDPSKPFPGCRVFVYTPSKTPQSVLFDDGSEVLRVVILDHYYAGRTWFLKDPNTGNEDIMVSGVEYVDERDNAIEVNGPETEFYVFSKSQVSFGTWRESKSSAAKEKTGLFGIRRSTSADNSTSSSFASTTSTNRTTVSPPYVVSLNKAYNPESIMKGYTYKQSFVLNNEIKANLKSGVIFRDNIDLMDSLSDSGEWKTLGNEPITLESAGVYEGHAWYKAEVEVSAADVMPGNYNPLTLWIDHASDFIGLYVNGRYVTTLAPMGTEINSASSDPRYRFVIPKESLKAGKNVFTFKTEIWGHGSFMFFRGYLKRVTFGKNSLELSFLNVSIPSLGYDSVRGVYGYAQFGGKPFTNWKLRPQVFGQRAGLFKDAPATTTTVAASTPNDGLFANWFRKSPAKTATPEPTPSASGTNITWTSAQIPLTMGPGENIWYKTQFSVDQLPDPKRWTLPLHLTIKGRNSKGTVYLNGRMICRWLSDEEWIRRGTWVKAIRSLWTIIDPDQCMIPPEMLKKKGVNNLTILFEETGINYSVIAGSPSTPPRGVVTDLVLSLGTYEPVKRDDDNDAMNNVVERIPLVVL